MTIMTNTAYIYVQCFRAGARAFVVRRYGDRLSRLSRRALGTCGMALINLAAVGPVQCACKLLF